MTVESHILQQPRYRNTPLWRGFCLHCRHDSVDKDGVVTITLNNLSIDKAEEVEIAFAECDPKHVTAAILTNDMHAYNTFEDPDKVHEEVFTEYKIADGRITFTMPACSVVMFRIK